MRDQREYNNIVYVKNLLPSLLEAVEDLDFDKIREIRGEIKAIQRSMTAIELSMGLIIGATEYYKRNLVIEDNKVSKENIEEDEEE